MDKLKRKVRDRAILTQIKNIEKKLNDLEKNIKRLYDLYYEDPHESNN